MSDDGAQGGQATGVGDDDCGVLVMVGWRGRRRWGDSFVYDGEEVCIGA